MTAIRHTLQKDIFEPDEERLLNLMHVTNAIKRRKISFLCLTVTTHHPVVVRIHEIRKSDREDSYKKKRFWLLRDLKVVDGINPRKIVPEFELTTDKVYKYLVTNPSEKDPFIKQIWKLCNRYLPAQKPDFINISLPVEEMEYANVSMTTSVADGISHQEAEADDYQPISAKEEEDFRHLLQKCDMSIGQAERFFDHLTRELSVLDSANIQTIMGSEMHLAELMNKIDSALEEANALEETLDSYDELLLHVREGVEMMEEKDSLLHIHTSNRQRLISELNQFLNSTSLSAADIQALTECNLTDPLKINRCTQAAISLQSCLNAKVSPGYERLKAYTDQMKIYENLRDSFAERFVAHLTALLRNLTSDDSEYGLPASGAVSSHDTTIYLPLKPFHDLVSWLKNVLPGGYKMLLDRYITFCKSMYRKEIGGFFELMKQQVRPGPLERRPSGLKISDSTDFIKSSPKPSSSGSLSTDYRSKLENQTTAAIDRDQFKKLIDQIFNQLEPIVQSEQKFCVWFFHVIYDLKADQSSATDNQSVTSGDSGSSCATPEKKLERLFNDQVRSILSQLFEDLDVQLQEFVSFCDRINPYHSIHTMSLLSDRALTSKESSGSYMASVLGKIVVLAKRRFDIFMETQYHSLSDFKLTKRTRVGVLPTLHNFENLASETEPAFKNCQRRGDLDRWYPQLILAVCQNIETIANDPNSKSPPSVVRVENYHRLFSILSKLKIACLEPQKKDAKQNYQQWLDSYVKEYMGRPMEKLQTFFDHVEACISQGMQPETIAYQQNFSKQELKKAISAYPGKEVKKGLEQLYKKVEKHLCEEENLLQVVWRNMSEEFIQQYKHYQDLIRKCYSGAEIQMEFGINDILAYFSDIAQQH